MDSTTLIGLVANITSAVEEEPKPVPTLTWVNVAIASSFILINGRFPRYHPRRYEILTCHENRFNIVSLGFAIRKDLDNCCSSLLSAIDNHGKLSFKIFFYKLTLIWRFKLSLLIYISNSL